MIKVLQSWFKDGLAYINDNIETFDTWFGDVIKKKKKKTTLSKQFQNLIEIIIERGKINIPNTHDHLLFWIGTGISIKSRRVKLDLFAPTSLLS